VALPRDVSLDGHLVDGAFGYLTVAAAVCFTIAAVVLLAAAIFHRGRRREALYTHGDRPRHYLLTLAVGLAMFVAVDIMLAARSTRDLGARFWRYPDGDAAALRVEVMARQWSWSFRYPGPDGRFGTPDDVVSLGELVVPVGRPVYLKLRSQDVVHSLYLPNFRTKIDAVPGNTTRLWFQAQEAGRFELGCAQHCGVGHYKMRGELRALAPVEWAAWQRRAESDARVRYDATAVNDGWAWETGG
jgi:cytochrome c oxidase subunit 2